MRQRSRTPLRRALYGALGLALLVFAPALAAQSAPAAGPTAGAGVTLQPGDLVRIQIWREQDLSGDFLVNERGIVTLPLLGDRLVTGIPIAQLRDTLVAQYQVQLRNPSITVMPLRRVNVLGEVQKPGLYPVDPTISLAGAIALASGTTPLGDLNRIRIIRDGQVIRERAGAAESLSQIDIRSGDQILVGRRSWLARNTDTLIGTGISLIASVITTLIIVNNTN